MLRQEENTGVFILGQGKRNLHFSISKRLMGCFQPLPAAGGGLLEGLAKGHQPKLHLLLPLLPTVMVDLGGNVIIVFLL